MSIPRSRLIRLCQLAVFASLAGCATSSQPPPTATKPLQTIVPASPPVGEPADLAGLKSTELREVFGAPNFIRKEGSMELWRYDNSACKVFFFLYRYGQALMVRHVETLPRGRSMAADQTCLDSLRPKPLQPVS